MPIITNMQIQPVVWKLLLGNCIFRMTSGKIHWLEGWINSVLRWTIWSCAFLYLFDSLGSCDSPEPAGSNTADWSNSGVGCFRCAWPLSHLQSVREAASQSAKASWTACFPNRATDKETSYRKVSYFFHKIEAYIFPWTSHRCIINSSSPLYP